MILKERTHVGRGQTVCNKKNGIAPTRNIAGSLVLAIHGLSLSVAAAPSVGCLNCFTVQASQGQLGSAFQSESSPPCPPVAIYNSAHFTESALHLESFVVALRHKERKKKHEDAVYPLPFFSYTPCLNLLVMGRSGLQARQ